MKKKIFLRFFLLVGFLSLTNIACSTNGVVHENEVSYTTTKSVGISNRKSGNKLLDLEINIIREDNSSAKLDSNSSIELSTGGTFNLSLFIKEDGFLYIYNVDSNNVVTELVSLSESKNFFKAKKSSYILPSELHKDFVLLGEGSMKEILYFLFSHDEQRVVSTKSELKNLLGKLKAKKVQIDNTTKAMFNPTGDEEKEVSCSGSTCLVKVTIKHK